MPSPQVAYSLSAQVYGGTSVAPYQLLVKDATGFYLPATAVNRALWGRSKMMATSAYSSARDGVVSGQHVGPVDSGLSMGAGADNRWLRANASGGFEVFTPVNGGSSDIVGKAAADGSVTLDLGIWTETMAVGNGGGGASPGGSDGDIQLKNGTAFAGLSPGASGNVPVSNGTTWGSGALPITSTSGTLPLTSTSGTLAVGRGGTGLTSSGAAGTWIGSTDGSTLTQTNRATYYGLGLTGTLPAGGLLRAPYNAGSSVVVLSVNDSTATQQNLVVFGAGDAITWGVAAFDTTFKAGNLLYITCGSSGAVEATNTNWGFALPVGGSPGYSQPFRFRYLNKDCSAGGTITLSATEAAAVDIDLTGSPGATFTLVLPTGAAGSMIKYNIKNATAQAVNIQKSGGTPIAMGAGGVRWVGYNPTTTQYEFRSA